MWAKILTCTNITLFMPTSVICQREAMSTWPSFELMLHTNKSIALTLYVLASTQRVQNQFGLFFTMQGMHEVSHFYTTACNSFTSTRNTFSGRCNYSFLLAEVEPYPSCESNHIVIQHFNKISRVRRMFYLSYNVMICRN